MVQLSFEEGGNQRLGLHHLRGPGTPTSMLYGPSVRALLLVSTLVACAHRRGPSAPDAQAPHWLDLGPNQVSICLSTFPDEPRLRQGRSTLIEARSLLREGRYADAATLLESVEAHPELEVHLASVELLQRQVESGWRRIRVLLEAHPGDPCLLHLAAMARLLSGDIEGAQSYIDEGVALSDGESELLYMRAVIQFYGGDPEGMAKSLRGALLVDSQHAGAAIMLAGYYLERGDGVLALPLLELALDEGIDVRLDLAPAYYDVGRMDDYIRIASELGWPLGDEGSLALTEHPLEALGELLGVGPEGALSAELETSLGVIRCDLFWREAPVTVANFVGLAKGDIPWTHPETGEVSMEPLYSGTLFHRVIPAFMVQGGDPVGRGTGGPGYAFVDEIYPSHRFEQAGALAMANSGPATNGSQFFVTEAPAPFLSGRHTLFGQCDDPSVQVVKTISGVPRDGADRPNEDVTLVEIRISGR